MSEPLIPEREFRRLLLAGVLWPAVLVLLFALSLFWLGVRAGFYRDRYLAAEEQDTATRNLRTDLLDMETGMRGYLLTKDIVYLGPYQDAHTRIHSDMERFVRTSAAEPETQLRGDEIRQQTDRWLDISNRLAGERDGNKSAQAKVLADGKIQFDLLRRLFNDLLASNSARIQIRSSEWQQERNDLAIALLAGAIVVVTALTFIVLFLMRRLSAIYHSAIAANELAGEKVRQLNSDLEQRVKERTSDLTRANQELEAFSYSVSHDLRAPLRSIASFSAIIQQDIGAELDAESADNLRRIRAAAAKMTSLIDALLKFSRIARSDLSRVHVDVSQMVESIIADLKRDNPLEVEVEIQPNMIAEGDIHLLRVVFENLLENAWKFSAKAEHPKVEIGTENGAFFVRDNGVGFEQQYVEKVFLPFERLHKEGDFPGTGIGLATTKRIIERHGGKIWANSVVNQGATFYFTLQ